MDTMNVVTLQGAMHQAWLLKDYIAKRDKDAARKAACILYRMGIEMIRAELKSQPLIPDNETPHPIVSDIYVALNDRGFQSFTKLQNSLSKVHRVFVELSWYQAWRICAEKKEDLFVATPFRDDLIKVTQLSKDILRNRKDAIDTRFEHRCAKQGARRLQPETPLWQKYTSLTADIAATAGDVANYSTSAAWTALKNLTVELGKDFPTGWLWYQSVHILRWESTRVFNMRDFDAKIASNIPLCREKGGNTSLCFTTILWEIIKRNDLEDDIRQKAFRGDDTIDQAGLIHVVNWYRLNTIADIIKHPSEITNSLLSKFNQIKGKVTQENYKKIDRFLETRNLAMYYLKKLASKEKYKNFHTESLKAIENSRKRLQETKQSINNEKVELEKVMDQNISEQNKIIQKQEDDRSMINDRESITLIKEYERLEEEKANIFIAQSYLDIELEILEETFID